MIDVDVTVEAPAWRVRLADPERVCRLAAEAAFARAASVRGAAEAGVMLTDDETMTSLNRTYRGADKPTNVLAFPAADAAALAGAEASEPPVLLGDIIVAQQTAAAEADAEGKTLADHLSHLVVHGMLHLLGYDHSSRCEADRMERVEIEILAALGIADPYASQQVITDAPADPG